LSAASIFPIFERSVEDVEIQEEEKDEEEKKMKMKVD